MVMLRNLVLSWPRGSSTFAAVAKLSMPSTVAFGKAFVAASAIKEPPPMTSHSCSETSANIFFLMKVGEKLRFLVVLSSI